MIKVAAAWLAKPAAKYILGGVAVLAVVLAVAWFWRDTFQSGKAAGAATVTNAVQTETIKRTDEARKSREKTDAQINRTPYSDRVDRLR